MSDYSIPMFALVLALTAGLAGVKPAGAGQAEPEASPLRVAQASGIDPEAPEVMRQRMRSPVEQRAQALLTIAEQHVSTHGIDGARDFSRLPAFVDRDLYVFALGMDGVFLGSGGWSASLVGQNVLDETDTHGNRFFSRMIDLAREQGRGQVQYYWFNPASPDEARKVTNFVKVGDVIVAVGFFPQRGTRTEARAMLRDALQALDRQPSEALAAFQDQDGTFVRNDLYVFAVDIQSGKFVSHGASPGLVGSNAYELLDATGRNVVREMADAAGRHGQGELDYFWINPMTGRIESKHTYFRKQGDLLIAVGSYNP